MIKFPDFASRGAQPARGGLRQGRAKCVSSDSRTFPALSPRVGFPLPRGVRGLPGLSLSHPDVRRSRGSRGRVTGRGPPHAEPAACAARGPPPRSVGRGPHPARVSLSFPICEPAARSPDARDFPWDEGARGVEQMVAPRAGPLGGHGNAAAGRSIQRHRGLSRGERERLGSLFSSYFTRGFAWEFVSGLTEMSCSVCSE